MKKLLFLFILGLGTAAFLFFYTAQIISRKQHVSEPLLIQVNNGASLKSIAENLYQEKLISNKTYFILYIKINKIYPKIKAGEYLIDKDVSFKDLADILTSGKVYMRKVTFPEGVSSEQAAEILLNNEFLEDDFLYFSDGEILPETYTFSRGDSRQKIINQAKRALTKILDAAWNERDADLPLKNKQEMLILASIVEKETGVAHERPQVASVFINRLRKGMLLQTDPTVIYAVTLGKTELKRPLSRRDLEIDSPYNTYKYAGLPPSPICNPGKAAIMAVAHPDKTPYLYFVASGNGGHNFARTLAEHNENVRKWRRITQ
ncbi:MAG: endolytic transglycosylase MltG [Alphaproteobacteria bacterium]|nr:endolytic transglycosylase MltG [Alphaproteobacteria bacterium]